VGRWSLRILLDTHVLLWWLIGDPRLGTAARELVARDDTEVFVSAASGWEIATKHRLGKLPLPPELVRDLPIRLAEQRFVALDVTLPHALRAGALPGEHRDPFDRMIAAQALLERLPVLTADPALEALGAECISP
jgi:PIN domain nuclease of toxin-antitoxin system